MDAKQFPERSSSFKLTSEDIFSMDSLKPKSLKASLKDIKNSFSLSEPSLYSTLTTYMRFSARLRDSRVVTSARGATSEM